MLTFSLLDDIEHVHVLHACWQFVSVSIDVYMYQDLLCSLQVLVDAVEDRAGGNHKVLAKKIAESPLGKQKL